MYKDTWCTYYFLTWDSKFIKHPCRIIATPVTGACVCTCGGTRSWSDWCNSLMLSHACGIPPLSLRPLSQKSWAFHSFFTIASSRWKWLLWSELGKQWILRWKRFSASVQYLPSFVLHWLFLIFHSFQHNYWTSVQKNFFVRYVRTFHRWTFLTNVFICRKMQRKFSSDSLFFFFSNCFIRQKYQ